MIQKFIKHGDNFAIIIDQSVLELLNITEKTEFHIRTDGVNIIIEPVHAQTKIGIISDNPKLQKIYGDLVEKYDNVLRTLSKN